MTIGMGIWVMVLTMIAMHVAGLETGRLAAVGNRHDGLIQGMVMFGLSAVAVMVLTAVAGGVFATGRAGGTHNPYALTLTADVGWILFVSLFLGWLAAMAGASTGASRRIHPEQQPVQEIKRAACSCFAIRSSYPKRKPIVNDWTSVSPEQSAASLDSAA